MDPEKLPFPDALRALSEEARQELGEHPAVEALTAYGEGRSTPEEAEAIQDHLVLCPECRELLLDFGRFPLPPFQEEGAAAAGAPRAAWQALRARLAGEREAASARAEAGRRPEVPRRRRRFYPLSILAASVLLAAIAIPWGRLQLSPRARPSPAHPRPHPRQKISLFPDDDPTRGEEEPRKVPASAEEWELILNLPEPPTPGEYAAEIERDGKVLGRWPLHTQDDLTLTLALRRAQTPPGQYRVRLLRAGAGPQEPVYYRFEVEER